MKRNFLNKLRRNISIYLSIYLSRTITDVCKTALLLTKPSSDDDSGFRFGFGVEASLPLAQSAPALSHDTTRLSDCRHSIGLPCPRWCSLSLILDLFHVYPLVWWRKSKISRENGSWVGNKTSASDFDRKYICYPAISDTLFSQILIFFQFTLMCPVEVFFKTDR